MDALTRLYITAGIVSRDLTLRLRSDRGQASTEYAGILFVIVAIVGALLGLGFTDIGQAIKDKIVEAVGKIGQKTP